MSFSACRVDYTGIFAVGFVLAKICDAFSPLRARPHADAKIRAMSLMT
jgi:hypothetical protein